MLTRQPSNMEERKQKHTHTQNRQINRQTEKLAERERDRE